MPWSMSTQARAFTWGKKTYLTDRAKPSEKLGLFMQWFSWHHLFVRASSFVNNSFLNTQSYLGNFQKLLGQMMPKQLPHPPLMRSLSMTIRLPIPKSSIFDRLAAASVLWYKRTFFKSSSGVHSALKDETWRSKAILLISNYKCKWQTEPNLPK